MEENKKDNKFKIGKIPIMAIVFPPIGMMMLVNYLINFNNKKKED